MFLGIKLNPELLQCVFSIWAIANTIEHQWLAMHSFETDLGTIMSIAVWTAIK